MWSVRTTKLWRKYHRRTKCHPGNDIVPSRYITSTVLGPWFSVCLLVVIKQRTARGSEVSSKDHAISSSLWTISAISSTRRHRLQCNLPMLLTAGHANLSRFTIYFTLVHATATARRSCRHIAAVQWHFSNRGCGI